MTQYGKQKEGDEYSLGKKKGREIISPMGQTQTPCVSVNKVLLNHSHAYSLIPYLQLLLCYSNGRH